MKRGRWILPDLSKQTVQYFFFFEGALHLRTDKAVYQVIVYERFENAVLLQRGGTICQI